MKLTLTTAEMEGLWRVRLNKALRWPKYVLDPENHRGGRGSSNHRGGPGYVVDFARPEEKALCRGQERFLEPIPGEEQEAARARLLDRATQYPKPAVNWLIEHGHLDGSARPRRRPSAAKAVRQRDAAAEPPPKVLPGLSAYPVPKQPEKTKVAADPFGEPSSKEPSDAVEGQEDAD